MKKILAQPQALSWDNPALTPLSQFFTHAKLAQNTWPKVYLINQNDLPKPADFLLAQPVMTVGVAQYYQRTPKVRTPLYILENSAQKIYCRGVIMIIDNNSARNNAILADTLHQSTIVELGLISMNIAALPANFLDDIKHSRTPFGALLVQYQIKTQDTQQHFFKIQCNEPLHKNLGCTLGQPLYGRTHTMINQQGIWIADVVEILTGVISP